MIRNLLVYCYNKRELCQPPGAMSAPLGWKLHEQGANKVAGG